MINGDPSSWQRSLDEQAGMLKGGKRGPELSPVDEVATGVPASAVGMLIGSGEKCDCEVRAVWLDPLGRGVWWWFPSEDSEPRVPVCSVALVGEQPQRRRSVRLGENLGWEQCGTGVDFSAAITVPLAWNQLGVCRAGRHHPVTAVFELRVGISVSGTDRFAAHRVEAYGDNAGWRTGAEVLISDGLIAELGATPLSRSGQEQP